MSLPKRKHPTQKKVTQAHVDSYVESLGGYDLVADKDFVSRRNAVLKQRGLKQPKK